MLCWLAGAVGVGACGSCSEPVGGGERDEPAESSDAPPAAPPASSAAESATAEAAATDDEAGAGAEEEHADSGPCPGDMRLVEGSYCLAATHTCLAWQEVHLGGTTKKNQCKTYREPSTCFDDHRQPMRFCMDTYEWPNQKGEKPRVLTSWEEARDLCEGAGKRLCTEREFNFACEGEALRPHVYGYERSADKCHIDADYRPRTYDFARWAECLGDQACAKAFGEIDQRKPAGSMPECVNEFGVYDLNGNANEWVMRPEQRSPDRAGLKGGWWGPVRNRCRPMVTFHNEGDWGYEVGFRCCRDASPYDGESAEE